MHTVEECDLSECFIDIIEKSNTNIWKTELTVNDKPLICKIDTGAQCNVISKKLYDKLQLSEVAKLEKVKSKLVAFSGNELRVLGQITVVAEYKYKNKFVPIKFHVVDTQSPPV